MLSSMSSRDSCFRKKMSHHMLLQSLARRWRQRVTSLKANLALWCPSWYMKDLFSGCFHLMLLLVDLQRKVTSRYLNYEMFVNICMHMYYT